MKNSSTNIAHSVIKYYKTNKAKKTKKRRSFTIEKEEPYHKIIKYDKT